MSRSDSPRPSPPLRLASDTASSPASFAPGPAREIYRGGPGVGHPVPRPGLSDGGNGASQVPGGPPCRHALLLDPGGTRTPMPSRARMWPSAPWEVVGSRHKLHFEAQSHGLSAPCLRFASRVAPRPCKTRFRSPAHLSGGLDYPQGPNEGFRSANASLPPSPGLAWRTPSWSLGTSRDKWLASLFSQASLFSHWQITHYLFYRGISHPGPRASGLSDIIIMAVPTRQTFFFESTGDLT